MEDEIKTLRSYITHAFNSGARSSNTYHQPIQQTGSFNERDYSRGGAVHHQQPAPSQHRHNRQNLNLNYGVINQDESFPTENDLVRPMNQHFNDIRKAEKLTNSNGKLNSYVSSPTSTENSNQQFVNNNQNNISSVANSSSRASSFSAEQSDYGTPAEHEDGHIVQMEKDTLELRRELQDALASKKHAENKIQA